MVTTRKAAGIVRHIDGLGRVVIPKELRRTLGYREGTPMEIIVDNEGTIIMRKYAPGCVICGNFTELVDYKGLRVCHTCVREMVKVIAS